MRAEPGADNLRRQARDRLLRLTSGEATDADARELRVWRAAATAHEAAFRAEARLWGRIGEAAARAGPAPSGARRRVGRRALVGAAGMAAGAAGLGLIAPFLGALPSLPALFADHHTGRGERARFELADGTLVELDAETRLSLPGGPAGHHARLGTGEAVFTVPPGAATPFLIDAARARVAIEHGLVVVSYRGRDPSVTCLAGAASVDCSGSALLGAGWQIGCGELGLGRIVPVDAAVIAAWRRGLLIFKDEPLGDVVASLNRYRPGRILLTGPHAAERRVSGVFHLARPDEALAHLRASLSLTITALPAGIVLLG